jgi:thiol:disulfide interchange protein DsbC
MAHSKHPLRHLAVAAAAAAFAGIAAADDAAIRKNIAERMPDFPKIDEIVKTPIPGIYEIRFGADIYYTDEQGNYVFDGQLIETKSRESLTDSRVAQLTAFEFAKLPLKDAIVWKQGTGARKMVVFADPNCGYCKKLEQTLQQVKNVTVYTFLLPILGGDSQSKSRDIWCAKDSTKAWRDWMLGGSYPVRAMGACDTGALQRNVAMARKHKINATPALVFEDGMHMQGGLPVQEVEKRLEAGRRS